MFVAERLDNVVDPMAGVLVGLPDRSAKVVSKVWRSVEKLNAG